MKSVQGDTSVCVSFTSLILLPYFLFLIRIFNADRTFLHLAVQTQRHLASATGHSVTAAVENALSRFTHTLRKGGGGDAAQAENV